MQLRISKNAWIRIQIILKFKTLLLRIIILLLAAAPSSGEPNNYNYENSPSPHLNTPAVSYYRSPVSYHITPGYFPPPESSYHKYPKQASNSTARSRGTSAESLCNIWTNQFLPGPLGGQQQYWTTERQDGGLQRKRKPFMTAVRDFMNEMLKPHRERGVIRVNANIINRNVEIGLL